MAASRCSMALAVLSIMAFLLLLLADHSEAQVNFSPSWGKRTPGNGAAVSGDGSVACRSSMEALLYIYKLVQSEAQKLVSCNSNSDGKFSD